MIIISFQTEYNNVAVKNSNSYMHDLVVVFINHTKFKLKHDYSKIQLSIYAMADLKTKSRSLNLVWTGKAQKQVQPKVLSCTPVHL